MDVLVFPFLNKGGKGVKKAIKKVASGLVRDSERSWFAELSDKGNVACLSLPTLIKLCNGNLMNNNTIT